MSISASLNRFTSEANETHRGETMKFLCMVFCEESKLEALTPTELQALDDESLAYDQALRQKGHLLAAQALQPMRTAATVRIQNGKPLIMDGPFAETREQIGGFILIEAKDRNEAIQIAAKVPVLRLGAIEIRPIKELTSSKSPGKSE
jgi:hypothetical protein